jgi:hypothetical protein
MCLKKPCLKLALRPLLLLNSQKRTPVEVVSEAVDAVDTVMDVAVVADVATNLSRIYCHFIMNTKFDFDYVQFTVGIDGIVAL